MLSAPIRAPIRRLIHLDVAKRGWTGARLMREEDAVLSSALLAAVAGMGLVSYRLCDRDARALRYYVRRQRAAYAVMTACLLILGACLASNGQFLVSCVTSALRSQVSGRVSEFVRRGNAKKN